MRLLIALSTFSAFSAAAAHTHPFGPPLIESLQSNVVREVTATLSDHPRLLAENSFMGLDICTLIPMDAVESLDANVTCTCDHSDDKLTISCEHPEAITAPGYGSVSDIKMALVLPLDLMERPVEATLETCATYGTDVVLEQLHNDRFCFSMAVSMDLSADEPTLPTISRCEATLNDTNCTCKMCDDDLGIELSCPDGTDTLAMECTEFFERVPGKEAEGGGGALDGVGSAIGATYAVQKLEKVEPMEGSGGGTIIPAVAPFVVSALGYAISSAFF